MVKQYGSRKLLLLALLFVSGTSSLIYESLWIRLLSLGVGSTAISLSIVLTFFFLGLSLGSAWIAKRVDRLDRPLRLYALLEFGIAIYAAGLFAVLLRFHEVLALLPFQSEWAWFGTIAKFLLAGTVLLPPAVAMGATLPLVLQAIERTGSSRNTVSLLYGINTLGALFGAVTTGFLWIPLAGVSGSNWIAIVGNLLVALFGLALARGEAPAEMPAEGVSLSESAFGNWRRDLPILAICGACGFVSLSTQVIWSKYLGIFLGTNIYGLSLVLGLYLFGIGAGSLCLPLLLKLTSPTRLFTSLALLCALFIGVTSRLLDGAPVLSELITFYIGRWVDPFVIRAAVAGLLLLIPTCIFGALFPLAVEVWSAKLKQSNARLLGMAYSVNTVGGILGSFLTGIVAIPLLGSSISLKILVGVMAAGAIFLVLSIETTRRSKVVLSSLGVSFALMFVFLQPFRFQNILKVAYPRVVAPETLSEALRVFSPRYEDFKLVVEGETSLISLSYDPADGATYRRFLRLKTNGLNESLYDSQEKEQLPRYEGLLGTLPYLFAENPQNAFVVGYGGGYTVDFLTLTPLKKVEVVELEKAVLTAANYVHKGKNPLLKRPNLNLRIEDARFILAAKAGGPYDIIVSQPSHSWLSGVANLFTEEFFKSVSRNLTPKGVFSQWLNLYNMDETVLKSILKTFYSEFPHGAVFTHFSDTEMILIGSHVPIQFRPERLKEILSKGPTQRRLAGVPVRTLADVLGYYALSREQALELAQHAPLNTDRNAYAETRQSRLFYKRKEILPQMIFKEAFVGDYDKLSVPFEENGYSVLLALAEAGQIDKFHVMLDRYKLASGELDAQETAEFAQLFWSAARYEEAAGFAEKAFAEKKTRDRLNIWLASLVGSGEYAKVLQLSTQYRSLTDRRSDCYVGRAHLEEGSEDKAKALFAKMEREIPQYTDVCREHFNRILGSYYLKMNRPDVALPFLEAYLTVVPSDEEAVRQRAIAQLELGEVEKAQSTLSNSFPQG